MVTQMDRTGWVGGPDTRGTFQILVTCLGTIFLCTYVVVHYDVPSQRRSWLRTYALRTLTSIAALLAPELVTSVALYEYILARKYTAWFRRQGLDWTDIHSFCFLMGGFTFDFGRYSRKHPESSSVETLDVDNISDLFATSEADFNAITQQTVWEMGKADGLGKVLACLQALFMIIQVFGRLVQRLPVTCLEASTLAYIPLTLLSYFFWLYKVRCVICYVSLPKNEH